MPPPHQVDGPPYVVILSIMYVGRTLHSDWYIMKKESQLHQAHCAFPCPDVCLSKSSNGDPTITLKQSTQLWKSLLNLKGGLA
ncbi:hypothetical protein CDL12_29548 [Handroanthus impetiginosus]|uniref:Uncharacterized protein n=1 Tax=Handroanthus impetiginosus TaxID=429701 RepID=A0A2G9FY31_9LAMI|nr:hypothetical protein CDL12_29548 [Handroanthus impetiginosus]